MVKHTRRARVWVAILAWGCLATTFAFAAGNIDPANKYAWSENTGWINAAPTQGGVTVNFDGSGGYLTGFAWGENIGWIKMGNDAGGPYINSSSGNWGVNIDVAGNLSGYAWGENVGWIKFNPSNSTVTVDLATGSFNGAAWGENIGWIRFKGVSPAYNLRTLVFDTQPQPVGYRMRIGLAGYTNRTETLTNFPVLVVLSNNVGQSGFDYSGFVTTNGLDLRFATNDVVTTGSLNYEIESWNRNGASYVWVQVPVIPGNGSGAIWANWGNSAASNRLACTTNGATWDANYKGVWHFAESGGTRYDATANRNTATTNSLVLKEAGPIDQADRFNYADGGTDYVEVANSPASLENLQEGDYSIECWFRANSATGALVVKYGYHEGVVYSAGQKFLLWHWTNQVTPGVVQAQSAASYSTGVWHHVAGTVSKALGLLTVYVDGQGAGTTFIPGASAREYGTTPWRFGYAAYGSYPANGAIDEVRLSSAVRSSNWVWACYQNQASNALFNTFSAVDVVVLPAIENRPVSTVTTNSATLNGYLASAGGPGLGVYALYGLTDGVWTYTNAVNAPGGGWTNGAPVSTTLTGLTPNRTYYYTFAATNSEIGTVASPSVAFVTDELAVDLTAGTGYLVDQTMGALGTPVAIVSGWDMDWAGGYVTNGWLGLQIVDTSDVDGVTLSRAFLRQTSGVVTVEFRFNTTAKVNGLTWQLRDGGTTALDVRTSGEDLCSVDGSGLTNTLASYSANTEVGIRIVANVTQRSADIYVNGVLRAAGVAFAGGAQALDTFLIDTGTAGTCTLHQRGLFVYRGYAVLERFLSCTTNLPPGWLATAAGGSVTVPQNYATANDPDSYSARLSDSSGTTNVLLGKSFARQTGKTEFEFKFDQPSKQDGFQARLLCGGTPVATFLTQGGHLCYRNGAGSAAPVWSNYVSNVWYYVRVTFDPATGLGDITINDIPRGTGFVLSATPVAGVDKLEFETSAGGTGDVWVDDILVYPFRDYPADYVPVPVPAPHLPYLIGMQACNIWREGQHIGWDWISSCADRSPILGFFDQGNPEAADWEIKFLVEHGVDFIIPTWLRFASSTGAAPLKGDDLNYGFGALKRAKYSNYIRYSLIIDYSIDPMRSMADWQNTLIPFLMEHFFKDPRYLVVDNKPVLASFGGIDGTGDQIAALAALRNACIAAGFAGVTMVGCTGTGDTGFEYMYTYGQQFSAESISNRISSPSVNWDRRAWDLPYQNVGTWKSATEYKNLLLAQKANLGSKVGLAQTMWMLGNWNEFGEGHFIMPTEGLGYRYLDVIREVFVTGAVAHVDAWPTVQQKARLNTLYPQPRVIVQPSDGQAVRGKTATFDARAVGFPPLTCQWRKDGVDIPGATNASYTFGPVQAENQGAQFRIAFSNAVGVTVSRPASLGVLASPAVQLKIGFGAYSNRTETLTNFPVLVLFSNDIGRSGFNYDGFVTTNGFELRFATNATPATNSLHYEIESWNTNGVSCVWVQVPRLPGDGSGAIWANWGNVVATNQLPCTTNGATWDTDYKGVWHFAESSGTRYDATVHRNTASPGGTVLKEAGPIGRADRFNHTDGSDYDSVANSASLENLQEGNYSIECWFRMDSLPTDAYGIVMKSGYHSGLHYAVSSGGTWLNMIRWDYTNGVSAASEPWSINFNPAWRHIVATVNRNEGTVLLYANGQQVGTASFTPGLGAREYVLTPWTFGVASPGNWSADGAIDEVRLSSTVRSANWVWASCMNQRFNDLFNTYTVTALRQSTPVIQNLPAANVTTTSATVNGCLIETGELGLGVFVLYGTTNGVWTYTNAVNAPGGGWTNGATASAAISGLTLDRTYYYTFAATNAVTNVVAAAPQTFITGRVTVEATDATAAYPGDNGWFAICRPVTCTNEVLTVYYTMSGSAGNGLDYTLSATGTVTLAAGVTSVVVTLRPTWDPDSTNETAVLTLADGAGYPSGVPGSATVTVLPATQNLFAWTPPEGTPSNTMFSVQVRKTGETAWTNLFVYKAQVGLQNQAPMDSSLVLFDFAGSVDVKVTYNGGTLTNWDIRPLSYGIVPVTNGNTLTFSLEQGLLAPRKLAVRINNDWYTQVLHILTNPLEQDAPQLTDDNVYAINPGDPIPAELPAGKTVYYFKPGQHDLPRGLWLDVDLGAAYSIDRVQLDQGQTTVWGAVDLANKFKVETRTNAADAFTLAYDGTANTITGNIERAFTARSARYVRLWLLGSTRTDQRALTSVLREFRVLGTGGSTNLALGRATGGGLPSYANATDGSTATLYAEHWQFGNWHAGETFYLSKNGYTMYVAGGAVVRGSITADRLDDITVRGRGVIDCRQLTHTDSWFEGRAHAIMLIRGNRPAIEGVTVIDGISWSVIVNWSANATIRNVNIINNKVNGDGIHFGGTVGTRIDGVFIRAPDDQFVCYHYGASCSNTVENSVVWADEVQTMLLGMGGLGDLSDFAFRNIDVVNSRGYPPDSAHFTGVLKLWANAGCSISNIVFQDIRVDPFQVPADASVFQFRNDTRDFPGGVPGGVIRNVTVSNLTYGSTGELAAKILADSNTIRDVRFVNYRRSGQYVTNAASANVVITGPASNITFVCDALVPLRTLTVISAQGGATPGTVTVTNSSLLSQFVVNSPVSGGVGTQYVCTAGVVAGNAYTQVSPTNVTLTLTNDATLTWQWQTQYRLTTATNGNGAVTAADGWYAAGGSTVLTATAAADWRFTGWTGDTNGCGITSNAITAVMSQARNLVARFAANVASNGTPYVWLTVYGLTNGTFDAVELTDPDRDGLVTWKEWVAGTDPTNAGSVVALAVPELDYGARTLLVRWVAGTNAWCLVERHYGSALTVTSAWLAVYSNAPGGPTTGSFVDSVGTNQWIFYRVRMRQQAQ